MDPVKRSSVQMCSSPFSGKFKWRKKKKVSEMQCTIPKTKRTRRFTTPQFPSFCPYTELKQMPETNTKKATFANEFHSISYIFWLKAQIFLNKRARLASAKYYHQLARMATGATRETAFAVFQFILNLWTLFFFFLKMNPVGSCFENLGSERLKIKPQFVQNHCAKQKLNPSLISFATDRAPQKNTTSATTHHTKHRSEKTS